MIRPYYERQNNLYLSKDCDKDASGGDSSSNAVQSDASDKDCTERTFSAANIKCADTCSISSSTDAQYSCVSKDTSDRRSSASSNKNITDRRFSPANIKDNSASTSSSSSNSNSPDVQNSVTNGHSVTTLNFGTDNSSGKFKNKSAKSTSKTARYVTIVTESKGNSNSFGGLNGTANSANKSKDAYKAMSETNATSKSMNEFKGTTNSVSKSNGKAELLSESKDTTNSVNEFNDNMYSVEYNLTNNSMTDAYVKSKDDTSHPDTVVSNSDAKTALCDTKNQSCGSTVETSHPSPLEVANKQTAQQPEVANKQSVQEGQKKPRRKVAPKLLIRYVTFSWMILSYWLGVVI